LRNDGEVWKEAEGVHRDGSKAIVLAMETPWLHFAEHGQGQQRIWHLHILGDYL
jgi:hypothetical protein